MVRAGFKTKLFCMISAVGAEYLKYKEQLPFGGELVYGFIRPCIEDLLSFMDDEDYHRAMSMTRAFKRRLADWLYATWSYLYHNNNNRNQLG